MMAKGGTIEFDVKVNGYWQTCPVCSGRGLVHCGFYNTGPGFFSSDTADETCRRCAGTGTITVPGVGE